ncbi:MAG: tRNA pseudouridine(55) synthase TruB, partial [Hydrogenophaga sp.]|nr:tRNA pseudouridine(55) synthase TruB [Hydrogenophaga sp.]
RFLSGLRRRGAWTDNDRVAVFGPVPNGLDAQLSQEAVLLGSAHTQSGELIPGRLLSPIEIQQILETSPELAS